MKSLRRVMKLLRDAGRVWAYTVGMGSIYGRECTLTLVQDETFTAVPFGAETLRAVPLSYALCGTAGGRKKEVVHTVGQTITGCFVTRLTAVCAPALFALLCCPEKPFTLLMSRVVEKVSYCNVRLCGFELRAQLDGALYLKIEVKDSNDSYTQDWDSTTRSIRWQAVPTWFLRDGDFYRTGVPVRMVYRYALSGVFGETRSYRLRLHAPYRFGHLLSSAGAIERLDYRLCSDALMSFFALEPLDDALDTDTGGELLALRRYRIAGLVSVTGQNGGEYWSMSL